ncbi:MAG: hypothetical protein JSU00_22050 [Acidobacteria bacterium]|nr:hypothetical protein [Acidobacteriota bacterium]
MLVLHLILAAVTIRSDGTPLRSGCDAGSDPVAVLAAGQPADVKFSLAGEDCFKVAVQVGGRTMSGYVRQADLANVAEFDRARQSGGAVTAREMIASNVRAVEHKAVSAAGANSDLRAAIEAINANEPGRALAMLEPAARNSRDINVLTIAGVAAWRSDDPAVALGYWKRALALRQDPDLQFLYSKVERETASDRSSGRLLGMRVLLRYEPDVVDADTARAMLLTLDTELSRISTQLGCSIPERLVAIVQKREAYLASSGAAEWSAGQYDGRIRVALIDESGVGAKTRRSFAHELAHACLANIGRFPAWLHEGVAQRLSGDQVSPDTRQRIVAAIAAKQMPKLEALDPRGAAADQARNIYGLALLAANLLFEKHGDMGIRNILANPSLLGRITEELDRELGL